MSPRMRPGRSIPMVMVTVLAGALLGAAALGLSAQGNPDSTDFAPASLPAPLQDTPANDPLFVVFEADLQAGQRVVMGASRAGVAGACFQCHGLQGQGDRGGAFPRLAGQPAWYLYKQLQDYANGTRPNEIMGPIAQRMSPQEKRDAAGYYAAARVPTEDTAIQGDRLGVTPQGEELQRGGAIVATGSPQRGLQNCVGCHGPQGSGMPPDIPYLAGQPPQYLELQLRLWAEGRRKNDPLGVMADVARRLTPQERRAVAHYFGALPPPVR